MNTLTRSKTACALTALLLTLALAGCSKPPAAPSEPLVIAPAEPAADQTVQASISSNTFESKYTAHLKNGRIARIDETRSARDGHSARGTYSFYEARLIEYNGDAIDSAEHEEVEFDLHGAIKQSQGAAGPLGAAEISAIRNRAELLRSHALTQEAVQLHQTK
jgi:hypothetical protein